MKKLLSHKRFRRIALLIVVDAVVFGLTDPQQVPSIALAAGFLLLAVTLYQVFLGLLQLANWYGLPGAVHRHRQARTLTALVGGLVALQSIGELGRRDVLVLLPLAFMAYLYMSYGKAARQLAPAVARDSDTPF
jgi:uncharacterized membrane protein YccC